MIVPLAGAGTSASTLSVETSTRVWPSSTASPSATCHSSTVPSVTDSPISGITICEARRLGGSPAETLASSLVGGRRRSRVGFLVGGACLGLAPRPASAFRRGAVAVRRSHAAVAGLELGERGADLDSSSTSARILVIVPSAGAGTSASTLSVETSTIGLALLDRIALGHVPLEDGALGDRLAHLGHLIWTVRLCL